ncbi:MAG: twin-arginine translocation pathway signal protein [Rhodoferax sp.]|nr:twin-arginine translocation pathway signal protein [Rhodoferax sp.]
MQRRSFIRIAGGGVVAAATLATASLTGCSADMPNAAIEAWQGPGADLAAAGDPRRWLLSYAILAPHSHNLQSWIVDLGTPGEITLSCDAKRLLPQTDPLSRQIMMSHGTFLEMLDLAARERGLRADITLFPEGAFGPDKIDARPVARIRLTPDAAVAKDPLFGQILRRRTARSVYDLNRPVPAVAWAAMADAVKPNTLRFGYAGLEQAPALAMQRNIAAEAWRIELTTPRTIMESFEVLRVGQAEVAQHRDGLTLLDPMVVTLNRLGLFDRSKAPAPDDYATTSQIRDFAAKLASTTGFLWMVTQTNDRVAQVNAGRAYARVQLAAMGQGLSMHPLSQALQEYPEQAKPYREIHSLVDATQPGQTVQMWARVGYASAVSPAPRRRLADFIRA